MAGMAHVIFMTTINDHDDHYDIYLHKPSNNLALNAILYLYFRAPNWNKGFNSATRILLSDEFILWLKQKQTFMQS